MSVVPGFVWVCLRANKYSHTCPASTTGHGAQPGLGTAGRVCVCNVLSESEV
ncbi:hypothetical protein BFJ70_g9933 [Fusarium oxysporum]|nr:hypothetical protein BFJ70_g9933 [Fusarium oxysporum]